MNQRLKETCKKGVNKDRLGMIQTKSSEITGSDYLKSFTIDSGCITEDSIIGAIYIKCLTGEFVNLQEHLSNESIEAKVGIQYEDGLELLNLGHYIVERKEKETETSSIKAYDYLINQIDTKYECGIDYSGEVTVKDLYVDVCRNLKLEPKKTSFLNDSIKIENNPFTNNETNRTVLKTIALIACSFVTIDENNHIDLSWLSDTLDYTFLKSDYSTLEGGEITFGPINTVVIKNSQVDSENVTKQEENLEEEHSIILSEDYILKTPELRSQAIEGIFERLKGLTYIDTKLTTYYGKPFLKVGSKIKIETDQGFIETYVLKHEFTYNGTFVSKIESPVKTEQEIKTKQNISLKEALKNTQLIVDKQNHNIEATIEEIEQQKEETIQLGLDLNGIKNSVQKLEKTLEEDFVREETLSNVIQQTEKETTNLISHVGGSNLLKNTQFYQNAEEWTKLEGTSFEVITGDVDVEQNTTNKSELRLKNGMLSQEFSMVIGKDYTLSFKYQKEGLNHRKSSIRICKNDNSSEEIFSSTEPVTTRKEYHYTYKASSNSARIEIITDQDEFKINDLIIQSGTSTEWSSNVTETRGLGHKLSGSDLELYDLGSSEEKAILDYNNLTFEQNGRLKAEYGMNNMQVNNAMIQNRANISGLTYMNIDDENIIVN